VNAWHGVDLDGTLAEYGEWRGIDNIGAPVPAMVHRVQEWLREGEEVRIFTARVSPTAEDREQTAVRQYIEAWCLEHIGQVLPITHEKDYGMIDLWDDRAVQVEPNTGITLEEKLSMAKAHITHLRFKLLAAENGVR
jgi:hypothetical protein